MNLPPTHAFSPTKHGTLAAWMRAKSANMVHRHIPADQKVAIFLKAVETFPELKAALDQIKEDNTQRKKGANLWPPWYTETGYPRGRPVVCDGNAEPKTRGHKS